MGIIDLVADTAVIWRDEELGDDDDDDDDANSDDDDDDDDCLQQEPSSISFLSLKHLSPLH